MCHVEQVLDLPREWRILMAFAPRSVETSRFAGCVVELYPMPRKRFMIGRHSGDHLPDGDLPVVVPDVR